MTRRSDRAGSTLLELLVALAVIGAMAGVAGLAFRASADPGEPSAHDRVAAARREALAGRRPVHLTVQRNDRVFPVTVLPDGAVLADTALGLDPLTGRPRVAPE